MFRHILVPLDGSSLAEKALPHAARLARASSGTITLLHVINPAVEYGPYIGQPYGYAISAIDADNADAHRYLDTVEHSEVLKDINVRKEVLVGEIAQSILDFEHKHVTDIVMICSHGRAGFKRWAMGSIAQKVARYSAKPVFVINGSHDPLPAMNATSSTSVLVALDGSQFAEAVLLPAAQICASLNTFQPGRLHLIRVVELAQVMRDEAAASINEMNERAIAEARTYLQQVEQRFHEGDLAQLHLTVTSSIVTGYDTADVLIREAEQGECCNNGNEEGCDIIALTTHGRSGVQRFIVGSIAERILSSTRLPMLIVRSTENTSARVM